MKSGGASNRPTLEGSFRIVAAFVAALSFASATHAGSFGGSPATPGAGSADGWAVVSDSTLTASSPAPPSSAAVPSPSGPPGATSSAASPSAALSKTMTVSVPEATPLSNAGVNVQAAQSTTEVPQAAPSPAQVNPQPQPSAQDVTTGLPPGNYNDGAIKYDQIKDSDLNGPPIRSLQDFMSQGDVTSPLGLEVREDKRKLNDGGEAEGLLIVNVVSGSPAAKAGLHSYHRVMRDALETAAVAGSLFFPPAVLMVPVLDQVHVGESYDMIIAVDGTRVTNFLDFQDQLRDVQPGEIVYLSIMRNGRRVQVRVPVPPGTGSLN